MKMRKGFTLVELLIVIIIIGILATMAVPQYNKMVNRAKCAEGVTIAGSVLTAQMLYYMSSSANLTNGRIDAYLSSLDISWDTTKWTTIVPVATTPPQYVIKLQKMNGTQTEGLYINAKVNCTSGTKTIAYGVANGTSVDWTTL